MNPGDRLGHYTVVAHLGSGGMGAVFRATDTTLGRDVALKVLPREVAADAERLERFQREARAIAALNHPNIVTIYSVEQVDGVHFLTMELVTGQPLDRLIDAGLMPIPQVETISREIADALAAAHDQRRHPPRSQARERRADRERPCQGARFRSREDAPLDGLAFGRRIRHESRDGDGRGARHTVLHVAGAGVWPQRRSPRPTCSRSAFCCTSWRQASRPFRGRSPADVRSSILRDAPRPVVEARSTVPPSLSRVIARCLEKDVSARFSTMGEVVRALGAHTRDARPTLARRWRCCRFRT